MKTGVFSVILVLGHCALAGAVADHEVIRDINTLKAKLRDAQTDLIGVSPPSYDVCWLPGSTAVPVDFSKFPQAFKKIAYAEMLDFGGQLLPIYSISIYEDALTRETVFLNMYGQEMLRLSPENDYDPFSWAKDHFNIESELELDEFHRWIFDPAHLAIEAILLPESFYPVYQEIQTELAAQESVMAASLATYPAEVSDGLSVSISAASMDEATSSVAAGDTLIMSMAAMSSIPPPPGGGSGTNSASGGGSSNLVVTLAISLPDGNFGHMGHIEIFSKNDLLTCSSWSLADDWVPTYGNETVEWTDLASSNLSSRFYLVSDAHDTDGDGHSDLYEAWVGSTDSNTFNVVNLNTNKYNDWLEIKIFGGLLTTNDFDGDGLLNIEELVCVSPDQPAVMISDPVLADSDNEGLNDYQERRIWHTEPMDPDTDDDGRNDAFEVLGSPPTDPHNPDTVSPLVTFAGN